MAFITDETSYKNDAVARWNEGGYESYTQEFFDWDNKNFGVAILMALAFPNDQRYKTVVNNHCNYWINTSRRSPKGLLIINEWGTLRHANNAAFALLMAANDNIGNAAQYRAFAKTQVDYALGSTGRSYVVGFGVNPPQRCHHRAA